MDKKKLGTHWLRRPRNDSAVIFVHGILSSSETAWTHDNGASWPELLASEEELSDAGICLFSYRTDWSANNYSLSDIGDSLREFAGLDNLWGLKSLIFVCHSLGGIVVRRFLVANQLELIRHKCRIGLFLVASPSLGSADANSLHFLARMLRNTQAQALRFSQQNVWLNDLDKDFMNIKKEDGALTIRGKELVEDDPILIKRLFGLRTQLVEPFSAARYFPESLKIPGSNHFTIAKPESRSALQHRALKAFVQRFVSPYVPGLNHLSKGDSDQATRVLTTLRGRLASGAITEFEALAAIQEALLTTRSYIQQLNESLPRDAETEDLLSSVWSAAGQAVLPYDRELAGLCWVKGHGWADNTVWNDARYRDLPVAVDDMLERLLLATRQASNSAKQKDVKIGIVEGTLRVDTNTWKTSVLLPPFAKPPEVTLARRDGRGRAPTIESVTCDKFTVSIRSSDQAGKWHWRAKGAKSDQKMDVVEGRLKLDTQSWKGTVLLPPFTTAPEITLVRPDGRAREDPTIEAVTPDKFEVSIRSSDQAGEWIWRARGTLLHV
jgi:pimeloyl-ACP methyl ester carboxylesterase